MGLSRTLAALSPDSGAGAIIFQASNSMFLEVLPTEVIFPFTSI
jgi:hypothetical protein